MMETRNVLAVMLVLLFGAHTFMPYFIAVPGGEGGVLIVGAQKVLESLVVFVLGYFYGTSKSSGGKDLTIADLAKPKMDERPDGGLDIPRPS